jgi:hypothetical protein
LISNVVLIQRTGYGCLTRYIGNLAFRNSIQTFPSTLSFYAATLDLTEFFPYILHRRIFRPEVDCVRCETHLDGIPLPLKSEIRTEAGKTRSFFLLDRNDDVNSTLKVVVGADTTSNSECGSVNALAHSLNAVTPSRPLGWFAHTG